MISQALLPRRDGSGRVAAWEVLRNTPAVAGLIREAKTFQIPTAIQTGSGAGMMLTINDPGNADLAITVGSTHRDAPHVYGVSYFSSKGPTGDGRMKPDVVAPGERILSCCTSARAPNNATNVYIEDSGTSMAAPRTPFSANERAKNSFNAVWNSCSQPGLMRRVMAT